MSNMSQMFDAMDAKFGEARPDTGQGFLGTWPPEGDHECELLRIEVDTNAKINESNDQGMKTAHPAVSYRFWYLLPENPDDPEGGPLEWGGSPMVLPLNVDLIRADNILTQIEITRNRLCGHLKTILGVPVSTQEEGAIALGNALDKALELINDGDQKLLVEVRAQYREYKNKRTGKMGMSRDEFLLNRLG